MAPRKKQPKTPACLLCGRTSTITSIADLFLHEDTTACGVRLIDAAGLSVDDRYYVDGGVIYEFADPDVVLETAPPIVDVDVEDLVVIDGQTFTPVEVAIAAIFGKLELPVLGGTSGARGWSSVKAFATCEYLWKRVYLETKEPERPSLSLGSLIHVFAAVYYMHWISPTYPLTPDVLCESLRAAGVNPDILDDAWRVWCAYLGQYPEDRGNDDLNLAQQLEPLAVEYMVTSPKSGRTIRIDLIARVLDGAGYMPGVYIIDHKSSSRFDASTLEGWRNDGAVLNQLDVWQEVKLDRRFGPLRGLMINLIGTQKKEIKFDRIVVSPVPRILKGHRRDMSIWLSRIEVAKASGLFVRNRGACVTRYGLCSQFDHCAGDDE